MDGKIETFLEILKNSEKVDYTAEFASFMIEMMPKKPFEDFLGSLEFSEHLKNLKIDFSLV